MLELCRTVCWELCKFAWREREPYKLACWEPCRTVCWVFDTAGQPGVETHRWVEDWLVCKKSALEADTEGQQRWACRPAWWGLAGYRQGPAGQYHVYHQSLSRTDKVVIDQLILLSLNHSLTNYQTLNITGCLVEHFPGLNKDKYINKS